MPVASWSQLRCGVEHATKIHSLGMNAANAKTSIAYLGSIAENQSIHLVLSPVRFYG